MKEPRHAPDYSEVSLVVRHLKLDEATKDENIQSVINDLKEIEGVNGVSFDEKTQVLNVAYDTLRISIDAIEKSLADNNVVISHDWWTHIKEEYYRFVDQNIKDNVTHKPACCNKPPH